jgi:hypothetical protein
MCHTISSGSLEFVHLAFLATMARREAVEERRLDQIRVLCYYDIDWRGLPSRMTLKAFVFPCDNGLARCTSPLLFTLSSSVRPTISNPGCWIGNLGVRST